ncbi:unnamed protein product, partial [Ilex paraguariensis]
TFSKPASGSGEPQPSGWFRTFTIAAYRPYFDVDTADVLERIKDSLFPFSGSFTEKTASNPDLLVEGCANNEKEDGLKDVQTVEKKKKKMGYGDGLSGKFWKLAYWIPREYKLRSLNFLDSSVRLAEVGSSDPKGQVNTPSVKG